MSSENVTTVWGRKGSSSMGIGFGLAQQKGDQEIQKVGGQVGVARVEVVNNFLWREGELE